MEKGKKYKTIYNPAGFVELYYRGEQTPKSVIDSVTELIGWSDKLNAEKKRVLILVDVKDVPKIDISGRMAAARKEAVSAMADAKYDRIAVYGNVAVQILVNTLALIAGKRYKVRVFSNRIEALGWLKGED
jgi:predicted glycosyltransferase